MAINRPKGTEDHLPALSPKLTLDVSAQAHGWLVEKARRVLERAGAQRIDTPLFEEADLVKRGVGGSTDIVRKEMFTVYYFGDHGGYILRPEGTAAIVRAYLQNGLKQLPAPLKLWTHGPMFRAERQQRGRLRQFHQVDYEVLGSTDALVDAEAIALMVGVVRELGLTGVRVKLGSIGDPEDRERYNTYLRELFTPQLERLSDDSKDRLTRNPMRILDSKSAGDQELLAELGVRPMLDFLGEEAGAHFRTVQAYLTEWGVEYDIDPSIVRGLDYYRRTAWELHHEGVGAKSALGGGGRYDGLAQELGSKETIPGIGWAFGVERLLLALEAEGQKVPSPEGPTFFVVALQEELVPRAAVLSLYAREHHIRSEFSYRKRDIYAAVRDAKRRSAKYLVIIGEEENSGNFITLKDIETGLQIPIGLYSLSRLLSRRNRSSDDINLFTNSAIDVILADISRIPSSFIGTHEYFNMILILSEHPRFKHFRKLHPKEAYHEHDFQNIIKRRIRDLASQIESNPKWHNKASKYTWDNLTQTIWENK